MRAEAGDGAEAGEGATRCRVPRCSRGVLFIIGLAGDPSLGMSVGGVHIKLVGVPPGQLYAQIYRFRRSCARRGAKGEVDARAWRLAMAQRGVSAPTLVCVGGVLLGSAGGARGAAVDGGEVSVDTTAHATPGAVSGLRPRADVAWLVISARGRAATWLRCLCSLQALRTLCRRLT